MSETRVHMGTLCTFLLSFDVNLKLVLKNKAYFLKNHLKLKKSLNSLITYTHDNSNILIMCLESL